MSYPNTGALWPNKYKKTDKHPDLRGAISIERAILKELLSSGEDEIKINLSGWKRETRNGDEFLSLAFDAYKKEEETKAKPKPAEDEDMPF